MIVFYSLKREKSLLLSIIVILMTMISCAPGEKSRFGVENWKGETLDGKPVSFSSIDSARFVVNFYSPTCQPCIEEIPALNVYARELKKSGIPVYMAVESWPESNGLSLSDSDPRERIMTAVKERIAKDVKKYNIEVPIVIMDEDFKITPGYGLITGTPETLVFDTNPLVLRFNFIGPISTATEEEDLSKDSRLIFALKKATGEI